MAHLNCVGETAEGLRGVVDEIAEAGIENVLALRGDPPRGQTDFVQPEDGLGSAAELTAMIAETPSRARDRRRLLPGGPSGGRQPRGRPRLPEDQGRGRRQLPDHPALLRQPGLLRFRGGRARRRDRGPDHPRDHPDRQLRPGAAHLRALRRQHPRAAGGRAGGPGRRRAGGVRVRGQPTAPQQCAELLARGAPGIHFYALNRWPATRAILGALRAARPWEGNRRRPQPPRGPPAAA